MISVKKVLNSSVVLVEKDSQEYIVLGHGIGYGRKVGQTISDDEIDEIFIPVDKYKSAQFLNLINEISVDYFDMTKDIVMLAEDRLSVKLNTTIYLTLADHLSFATERQKKGLTFTNRLQWELETYYENEFKVGRDAIDLLSDKYQYTFPDEEAANIAFHIINAQDELSDESNGFKKAKLVSSIINLVKYASMCELNTASIHYNRFLIHVRYFADRFFSNLLIDEADGLYKQMWHLYPIEMGIALRIAEYIMQTYQIKVPESELAYLGVHINRLIQYSSNGTKKGEILEK